MVQTHYNFDPDVLEVVRLAQRRFKGLHAATYVDHPWPNWDGRSVDYWDNRRREWGPLSVKRSLALVRFLIALPGAPYIRHYIRQHTLWTSWGGFSVWDPDDHSGSMSHVHVTYWPPT